MSTTEGELQHLTRSELEDSLARWLALSKDPNRSRKARTLADRRYRVAVAELLARHAASASARNQRLLRGW